MKKNVVAVTMILFFICFCITGCVTTRYPKDFLKLSTDNLQTRQLQMRQFETTKEKEVIYASAGALQDMGFTIDDDEMEVGLVVASKNRDATDAAQVTLATVSVVLSALAGTSSNAFAYIDKEQKIKASVVTRLNAEGNKVLVRVTFQRIVWNNSGNVSKIETLKEPTLYQGFFERISKAIFLEEQKI